MLSGGGDFAPGSSPGQALTPVLSPRRWGMLRSERFSPPDRVRGRLSPQPSPIKGEGAVGWFTSLFSANRKALIVWLNSTLGLLTIMAERTSTEGSWVAVKKADLEELPVLDTRQLSTSQLNRLSDLFDEMSEAEFERVVQALIFTILVQAICGFEAKSGRAQELRFHLRASTGMAEVRPCPACEVNVSCARNDGGG